MFVTPAFARAPSLFGGDNMLVQLLPFVLIFVIMYSSSCGRRSGRRSIRSW
jgi:hypothetical protein